MLDELTRPEIIDSPRSIISSVDILRSILPDDTLSMDLSQGLSTGEMRSSMPSSQVNALERIESLSEEASTQKSTILNRLQHSLTQLHDMREHFESLLKEEKIDELQTVAIKLQGVTKKLFTQLNQVMEERDFLAEKADGLKASLLEKDQNLIKVMKREEIQVKKLRESAYQQRRLKEKRDEVIQFMFDKAEELDLTVSELKHLYNSVSVFYDTDRIKPVELHGKYGIKTQITDSEARSIHPNDSQPVVPGKMVNVIIDFSVLRDQKSIDVLRQQIQKDSIWHLRTTELRERSMNDLLKQIDTYYSRDAPPDVPDFRASLQIKKDDIESNTLEQLWDVKVEPNKNLTFQKTKYNINRMINETYAAKNGNTAEDFEIRERNLANLKEIREMLMKSLAKLDPRTYELHLNIKDDIFILRERCKEIKKILRAFIEDYNTFKNAAWKDFIHIRNATNDAFRVLKNQIEQMNNELQRLKQENAVLRKNANGLDVNQSITSTLPPIDEPISMHVHINNKPKTSHSPHKLICNHNHDHHSPMNRPCCNQVIPRYFKGLPNFKGSTSKRNLNQVDVSLWFQEPIEPKTRKGERGFHFLGRSFQ